MSAPARSLVEVRQLLDTTLAAMPPMLSAPGAQLGEAAQMQQQLHTAIGAAGMATNMLADAENFVDQWEARGAPKTAAELLEMLRHQAPAHLAAPVAAVEATAGSADYQRALNLQQIYDRSGAAYPLTWEDGVGNPITSAAAQELLTTLYNGLVGVMQQHEAAAKSR